MAKTVINGVSYDLPDNANISISGGVVKVNGRVWDEASQSLKDSKDITIEIHGSVGDLSVKGHRESKVDVTGDVNGLVDANTVNVGGDVKRHVDGNTVTVGKSVGGHVDGNTVTVGGDVGGYVDGNTVTVRGNVTGRIDAKFVNR